MRGGKASCRDFVVALTALTAFSASLSANQPKRVFKASNLNHVTLGVSDVKKSASATSAMFITYQMSFICFGQSSDYFHLGSVPV